ncbi:MAG TPA: hypothetical protein VGA87_09255, partial [Pyrinomonadaceae bacterium]
GGYVEAINEGQAAFLAALNKRDAEAANRAVARLDLVAPLDQEPDQIRLELRQLLLRAHDLALLGEDERKGRPASEQLKQLAADFQAWDKRSDDWVKTEGANYGIAIEAEEQAAPETGASPASK